MSIKIKSDMLDINIKVKSSEYNMEDKKLNRGALYNSTDKIFKGGKINVNGNDSTVSCVRIHK